MKNDLYKERINVKDADDLDWILSQTKSCDVSYPRMYRQAACRLFCFWCSHLSESAACLYSSDQF